VAARSPRDAHHQHPGVNVRTRAAIRQEIRGEAANSTKEETTMIGTRKWAGFRSVLCPIDFSEHSRHALEYAAAVALNAKAGLHVLYVSDPLLMAAAAAALRHRQLDEQTARELQAFIDGTLPLRTRKRVGLTALVSAGDPADQILKAAARHRSDLIVVGSHGANAAKRLLVGSTTLDLLQRSTVPVLAIPRRLRRRPSRS
jgi:universal stress protein A